MKRKAGFFILLFALSGMAYTEDSKDLIEAAMTGKVEGAESQLAQDIDIHAADKQNVTVMAKAKKTLTKP